VRLPAPRARLFLFDIDGTLLSARGAGRLALGRALEAVYGTTGPLERYDFRGKTDPRIVLDLMQAAGLTAESVRAGLAHCFAKYVEELEAVVGDGAGVSLMPGIAPLVRTLAARPDVVVGLLTGNIEAGARVKLRPTGLAPLFRVGAFGSDDADRRCLPAVAVARARALGGHELGFSDVTIIGDTPLDVDCARACGAVAVAVATGHHAAAELASCAPDLLFADFSDVAASLAALLGGRP
jgi:phosphoglycolate phosphatase-like HAD superfamily hydrolase